MTEMKEEINSLSESQAYILHTRLPMLTAAVSSAAFALGPQIVISVKCPYHPCLQISLDYVTNAALLSQK